MELPQAANSCRCLQAEGFFSFFPWLLEVWCPKANGRSLDHNIGQVGALDPKWICGEGRGGERERRVWLPELLGLNPATQRQQGSFN